MVSNLKKKLKFDVKEKFIEKVLNDIYSKNHENIEIVLPPDIYDSEIIQINYLSF